MDKIKDVAAFIINDYLGLTGKQLFEMKLHKLLYFTQRESLAVLGEPAFEGDFEGWSYGPVCRELRSVYVNGSIAVPTTLISKEVRQIASKVVHKYGLLDSWKLSKLSLQELSWNKSRKGLTPSEHGGRVIPLEDIREDAKKLR